MQQFQQYQREQEKEAQNRYTHVKGNPNASGVRATKKESTYMYGNSGKQ